MRWELYKVTKNDQILFYSREKFSTDDEATLSRIPLEWKKQANVEELQLFHGDVDQLESDDDVSWTRNQIEGQQRAIYLEWKGEIEWNREPTTSLHAERVKVAIASTKNFLVAQLVSNFKLKMYRKFPTKPYSWTRI